MKIPLKYVQGVSLNEENFICDFSLNYDGFNVCFTVGLRRKG